MVNPMNEVSAERPEAALRIAAKDLLEACWEADNEGDLSSTIDGALLDAVEAALAAPSVAPPQPRCVAPYHRAGPSGEYDHGCPHCGEFGRGTWRSAWLRVPGALALKSCPSCRETALEGEDECSKCGIRPLDDISWRSAAAPLQEPAAPKGLAVRIQAVMDAADELSYNDAVTILDHRGEEAKGYVGVRLQQILDIDSAVEELRPLIEGAAPPAQSTEPRSAALTWMSKADVAPALMQFGRDWKLDGDLIYCRKCARCLHVSRNGEPLRHVEHCPNAAAQHPWSALRFILQIGEEARAAAPPQSHPAEEEFAKVWIEKFESLGRDCAEGPSKNVFYLCADYLRAAIDLPHTPVPDSQPAAPQPETREQWCNHCGGDPSQVGFNGNWHRSWCRRASAPEGDAEPQLPCRFEDKHERDWCSTHGGYDCAPRADGVSEERERIAAVIVDAFFLSDGDESYGLEVADRILALRKETL